MRAFLLPARLPKVPLGNVWRELPPSSLGTYLTGVPANAHTVLRATRVEDLAFSVGGLEAFLDDTAFFEAEAL